MISKEAEKIEEKFSNGESLTSGDIHTLVLKTQYNHINHLDKKIDEVTSSVKELEHKFEYFETRLENEFKSHQQVVGYKIESLEKKIETEKNRNRNKFYSQRCKK